MTSIKARLKAACGPQSCALLVGYICMWTAGVVAIVDNPEISVFAGPLLTDVWGWLTVASSIPAGIGALTGMWWMERAGLYALVTACIMQLVIISGGTLAGSALSIHAAFVVFTLGAMIARLIYISSSDLAPARAPVFRGDPPGDSTEG